MKPSDSVNQSNVQYIDELYQQYQKDPFTVDEHWRNFFAGFEVGVARPVTKPAAKGAAGAPVASAALASTLSMGVFDLVHSYRELGHFEATLDPLGLKKRSPHPLLQLSEFGMTDADLDRQVGPGGFGGQTNRFSAVVVAW